MCSGTPFTGNYGKAAPHPALRATFPHGGRLTTIRKEALLLLLSGACAILGEKSNLSPALLPLPVLSGAVVVLYLCGVAGFLRVGAVAVLLALAAVWVVGLVQYRPAGVAAAWKRAASVPGFTLFLGGAAFIWLLFCVQQPMFTQWDEFTAWGLAPKMVVERGAFYVADPVNLKASFTYPATSLITFLFQPFGPWAEWACLAAIDTLKVFDLVYVMTNGGPLHATEVPGTLMYSAIFQKNQYGYGSAIAVFIVLECVLFTFASRWLMNRVFGDDRETKTSRRKGGR